MLLYALFRIAGVVAPLIPRRAGYALMGVAARLIYAINGRSRRMIQCNLRHVLGPEASEADIDRTARRIFHSLLKNYFDLFWLPAQRPEDIAGLMTVHGRENANAAFAMNKGVIAVTVHLGNQEMMTQMTPLTGYAITIVAEHIKPERVYQYLVSLRQNNGVHIVPQDGALREIFRALKRNEAIGLVFDRDVTDSGRVIDYFGAPAKLPDGYAILALKTGAPILTGAAVRDPGDRYGLYLNPPMVFTGRADNDDDVKRVMRWVGATMEQYTSQFLEQWVYFHYLWEADKERVASEQQQGTQAREVVGQG